MRTATATVVSAALGLAAFGLAAPPALAENPVVEHQSKWNDLRERDREDESRDAGQAAETERTERDSRQEEPVRRSSGMSTPAASR